MPVLESKDTDCNVKLYKGINKKKVIREREREISLNEKYQLNRDFHVHILMTLICKQSVRAPLIYDYNHIDE